MENNQIKETDIWAYISKNSDEANNNRAKQWINSNDYDAELFNKINAIYKVTGENLYIRDLETYGAKQRFFKSIETNKKSHWKNILKYAAVLLILITSVTYTYQKISDKAINIQTTYSEQKQVNLSDGSKVWLNASSKLSYNEKDPRTIYLEGEAFFEVTKDKDHPFTVETLDNIIVKALGTSFNVKSYQEQSFTETTLLTGKVELSSKNYFKEKIIMLPTDKIRVVKKGGQIIKSISENVLNAIAWKEGEIKFKNKPFKEIANDLSIQKNITIHFINEQISNFKFTGSFDQTTPIREILEVLKASKIFEFEHNPETNAWVIK
jgi:transmembrane sensor